MNMWPPPWNLEIWQVWAAHSRRRNLSLSVTQALDVTKLIAALAVASRSTNLGFARLRRLQYLEHLAPSL